MLRGFAFGIKVIFLNCFKGSRKWTRLCCLSGGMECACVRVCVKIYHGSQTSFYPYELINIQSCLVWTSALLLVLFESSSTAPAVRPCRRVACVALLTINVLCLCHIPLSTVLSSTADCGGDACSLVLSATWGLTSCFRGQDTNVTEKPQVQADGKWKCLFGWNGRLMVDKKRCARSMFFVLWKKGAGFFSFKVKAYLFALLQCPHLLRKIDLKASKTCWV